MKIEKYIYTVLKKKKALFFDIEIDKDFEWDYLIQLCNLELSSECLYVSWSLIIDAISETYKDEEMILFIPKAVLDFLIDNSICLMDLAHLKLPPYYLLKIYEKDNSCWETLETIEAYKKKN